MSRPSLPRLLAFWQRVLRLQDWQVSARYVRHHEISGMSGDCTYNLNTKRASIRLVVPSDRENDGFVRDVEETLVHELGHLHFAPFETRTGTPMGLAEEQAINAFRDGLIALHRRPVQKSSRRKRGVS